VQQNDAGVGMRRKQHIIVFFRRAWVNWARYDFDCRCNGMAVADAAEKAYDVPVEGDDKEREEDGLAI